MQPVQHFKTNFDQSGNGNAITKSPVQDAANGVAAHDTDSLVRNLCFIWTDGRKAFFNYAYLVSVDLVLIDPVNVMLLYFSGQIVTLKGYCLEPLFDLLLDHTPKVIAASDSRYCNDEQTQDLYITEILVKNE